MNHECYYRISIKGIAVDKAGRFLLAREDNGRWDMLGGGLEHGEHPIDCLRREISEEAGLTITDVSEAPEYFVTGKRLDKDTYIANVIYRVELADLNFTPSDECQELRYLTAEEALHMPLFPTTAEFVALYGKRHNDQVLAICCRLLEISGVAESTSKDGLTDLSMRISQLYGHMNIYNFSYLGNKYHVTNDYSLEDNPAYVEAVIKDMYPNLTGTILKNPVPQSDGACHAFGLDGIEYYIWRED